MPVVQTFDWPNRRIHMAVSDWHPIDIYREHRAERRIVDEARKYPPMVAYQGNVAKGGGKFTPRFMTMIDGAKIVPVDGSTAPVTTISGEIITDDQSEFIDVGPLAVRPLVKYQPPEAEIIEVATSGNEYTLAEIRDEVWQRTTESGFTVEELMRLLSSVLCGKTIIQGNVVRFRDLEDSKDRIVAETDGKGNRTAVTYDAG